MWCWQSGQIRRNTCGLSETPTHDHAFSGHLPPGGVGRDRERLVLTSFFNIFSGYYVDKLKRTCEPCDLHCKSCVEGHPSACTSCKTNFYLKDQSCVSKSECRSLYFVDEETGRCNFCPSQCTRCDSEKHCTECFLSYYLTPDNRCVSDCPKGTFRVASQRFV